MSIDRNEAIDRVVARGGVVVLLGAIDSGKTTFALELGRRALDAGSSVALVDGDIGQSTIGPPATVGLKVLAPGSSLDPEEMRTADALAFVGALSPRGHVTSLLVGVSKLVGRAKGAGSAVIIVDTTGFVSGTHAQMLKLFKLDLLQPEFVVAFQRGAELEPLIGIAQRFTSAEMFDVGVAPEVVARSAEDRMAHRERQFAAYFAPGTSRWKVRPTVFAPTLPPEFDLSLLDGLIVGMEDGKGTCAGMGILEYDAAEDMLRMVSPVSDGVRGLRLGSVRIDTSGRSRGSIELRQLLGSE